MGYRAFRVIMLVFIAALLLSLACGPAQYTLKTTVIPEGAGTITPADGKYEAGTEVTLTAEPASGYAFDQWTGDATGTNNSITISMDSNKTIIANFSPTYTLNTSASPGGGGTVSPASGTYAEGAKVNLLATPAKGYTFYCWDDDASGTSNPITITMNSAKSVTALFRELFMSSDARIGFILDKIEHTQNLPDDLEWSLSPKNGHDFVIVHVKIAFIPEGHVTLVSQKPSTIKYTPEETFTVLTYGNRYVIYDTNGTQYNAIACNWEGVKVLDPRHMTTSWELVEGSTTRLIFEIPVTAEMTKLEIPFVYFKTWDKYREPQSPEEQHVNIILK